jgi:aminopeptidase N
MATLSLAWACGGSAIDDAARAELRAAEDPHSFARPQEIAVTHIALDLDVDFDGRRVSGTATLALENLSGAETLVLDSRDLEVESVTLDDGTSTEFHLGEQDAEPSLGQPLIVKVAPHTTSVTIEYRTSPVAAALQWLDPQQTAGRELPFLYSQGQAILTRSWIPCQDTPAVRTTYDAVLRVPPGMLALMSAENPREKTADGVYRFRMPQPVPSYLIALAVGDLEFRDLGPRTGVYAEPPVIDAAAHEFADTEAMMEANERLYGPYRWGRYDILVLPPSFPFGGMENPRLTFVTPTILAGDRSLTSLIAHELAHSWSGNLVTNATWDDLWLNEGFTVYVERRVMEQLYGRDLAEMLWVLGSEDLGTTIERLGAEDPDTRLSVELAGRDPDDAFSDVPYEKGSLMLRAIEEVVGREELDRFLRAYFEAHSFRSLATRDFVEYLRRRLPAAVGEGGIDVEGWIHDPGLVASAPRPESSLFEPVERQVDAWRAGAKPEELVTAGWSALQWQHFLRGLPEEIDAGRMEELDSEFGFSRTGNDEILFEWLVHVVSSGYERDYGLLEEFLGRQGRRKFLRPLYQAMSETPEGLARAREIYGRARPTYHSVSRGTIDDIVEWSGKTE